MKRHLLMIFLKFPQPGRVKTRLARAIGDEAAAAIYRKLVARVAQQVAPQDGADPAACPIWIFFDPPGREAEVRAWLAPHFGHRATAYQPQLQGDLGQRLSGAFAAAFAAGFDRVAAIGTDCVSLDAGAISRCWQSLETCDVVFGPAEDGGYYLIGLKREGTQLFDGIPWSSARTLEASKQAASRMGWECAFLPTLSDVDELAQWEALCASDPDWIRDPPEGI